MASTMWSLKSARLPAGLATLCLIASAAVHAQEFNIEDVSSPAKLAIEQIKSRTIAFVDRPSEELIDPDAGLIRFEDWAHARPVEKQFLSPFPSYVEPQVETVVDGVRKRFREKLHMYVGEARFALARAPGSLDLAGLVSLPFIERIDPAIKHRLIAAADAVSPKDPVRSTTNTRCGAGARPGRSPSASTRATSSRASCPSASRSPTSSGTAPSGSPTTSSSRAS